MTLIDDDLRAFEIDGATALPESSAEGYVEHDSARIWYGIYGSGDPVVLLHGALGNSSDWGFQVPALIARGHRAILIDNRGRGRSTRGTEPFSYELMAAEVLAVMDALRVERAAVVGWSDGAIIGLVLAMQRPERVSRVFAFGANMDLSGVKDVNLLNPLITRVLVRAKKDYTRLSSTPDEFKHMSSAVNAMMATQPNYSADDLATISIPVAIVSGDDDEFIETAHTEYLASAIPDAKRLVVPGTTHFAPVQRPDRFNEAMLAFLRDE